jgi:hypothetical protein
MTKRPETKSISIEAKPQDVLALVGNPRNLPRWAPKFAPAIRPDGPAWVVGTGEDSQRIVVRVSRDHGTVDFLAANAPEGSDVGASRA